MRREWNIEEIEYMKEFIGLQELTSIAESMNRSYESVRVKMNRLGITNTKTQTGYITAGELAKHLKVDRNTVKGWIIRHGLPCKKRVTRASRKFHFIDPTAFWKWAERNKEKVQFLNIDTKILLPEPDWVMEERRKEIVNQAVKKKTYQIWTTKEDQILVKLRSEGMPFKEISHRLGRSTNSVTRRFSRVQKEKNLYEQN